MSKKRMRALKELWLTIVEIKRLILPADELNRGTLELTLRLSCGSPFLTEISVYLIEVPICH